MFKKVFPLSAILSLRFLGLFLVLPVISIYAASMTDNLLLVGIIVGGYALTQAIFQVPFGIMSDRIGRKPTILIGLIIFLIGSLIAAFATDIYTLMIGRFLQGAGAIGSVVTAMISDLVEEEVRGKAMAIMGATIAISFAIAMGLGPVIGASYGVDTLFIITGVLAILAMILLFTKVPTPPRIKHTYHENAKTSDILKDSNLLNMIIINAMQKGLMTVAFVLIPIILTSDAFAWEKSDLYMAYLPAMILGLIAMGPAAVFGEKHNKPKQIFLISIVLFIGSFLLMGLTVSSTLFIVGVSMFFIAFNMMEPLVQSMITKFAKVHQKGAALGISNSVAYFATFIGGTLAGLMLDISDRGTIGISVAVLATIWLLWTLKLQNPTKHSHLFLSQDLVDTAKLSELEHEHIAEWYVNETENLVVVKYVADAINENDLKAKISL
ncbi:major facilitator family transporter [Sulfurimonas gotlandica GD1]|uniref:Major facilitator family transporter n=1 Tax=Sulfurimonas gotlandica (strain DSM 19862 / JCM 16533 / GD1) TaxID=929558 RepID=B6BHM8_SULGG|nr:MFS transporter [Sulfurimonas gotlandica]EDZ63487.1 major facilitator superfamily protein [Sulfurimonas gotlandica GD1]EHP30026.1 major facilitator family transporter [Sulfurimonas gotlandica GD1]